MSSTPPGRRPSVWPTILTGLAVGALVALGTLQVVDMLRDGGEAQPPPARVAAADVPCFRLPWGGSQELLLVPAGPDGMGEESLSRGLFPGEDPPRALASLLLANVSATESWDVDLTAEPLRVRRSEDDGWQDLEHLGWAFEEARVPASARLRLRALGAGVTRTSLESRSLRRVLLALPPTWNLDQVKSVQWGETTLRGDRLRVGDLRRFRSDPAAVASER